jgi:hypothetical protein
MFLLGELCLTYMVGLLADLQHLAAAKYDPSFCLSAPLGSDTAMAVVQIDCYCM